MVLDDWRRFVLNWNWDFRLNLQAQGLLVEQEISRVNVLWTCAWGLLSRLAHLFRLLFQSAITFDCISAALIKPYRDAFYNLKLIMCKEEIKKLQSRSMKYVLKWLYMRSIFIKHLGFVYIPHTVLYSNVFSLSYSSKKSKFLSFSSSNIHCNIFNTHLQSLINWLNTHCQKCMVLLQPPPICEGFLKDFGACLREFAPIRLQEL